MSIDKHDYSVNVAAICGDPAQPFAFEQASHNLRGGMAWKGQMADVVRALRQVLNGGLNKKLFWHPARLVRGVIDNLTGPERIKLVSLAAEVAIRAYAGSLNDGQLDELEYELKTTGLICTPIQQQRDATTANATNRLYAGKSTQKIIEKLGTNQPILMIGICHGGLVAAIQTALLNIREGVRDELFYPIRYSQKCKDTGLFLPDEAETRHIIDMAEGRIVIVHDEDAATGATLANATRELREKLPQDSVVLGIANKDIRPNIQKTSQGEWFEQT